MFGGRLLGLLVVMVCLGAVMGFRDLKDLKSSGKRYFRPNVCESDQHGMDAKIVCYCTTPGNKTADCWVNVHDLYEYDQTWSGFEINSDIRHLILTMAPNGQLNYLPMRALQYLHNLRSFTMIAASVPVIKSHTFSFLSQLDTISLVNNQIVTLENYAFADLSRLRTLNISFNQVTFLDRNVFHKCRNLEVLSLIANNISSILDGAFSGLEKLDILKLDFNFISVITRDTFRGLDNLSTLGLVANYISILEDNTFDNLRNLIYLDMRQNAIQSISPRTFNGLTKLQYLNLEQNELKMLDSFIVEGLSNLFYLNLAKNLLTTFLLDEQSTLYSRFQKENTLFYLNDNNLVCDCRLNWVFSLHSSTKSPIFKEALNSLQCELIQRERTDFVYILRLNLDDLPCEYYFSTTESLIKDHRPHHNLRRHYYPTNTGTVSFVSVFLLISIVLLALH
ncbi:connectin [Phlebotomus argentipes]|uniref:connectin n=1 Tax=Phlebotomus argentipes TaxID=94469 RepID=UPI002892AE45|nr:connectin [Phlebotomus argentipes]